MNSHHDSEIYHRLAIIVRFIKMDLIVSLSSFSKLWILPMIMKAWHKKIVRFIKMNTSEFILIFKIMDSPHDNEGMA
jgi:hypothetical protein